MSGAPTIAHRASGRQHKGARTSWGPQVRGWMMIPTCGHLGCNRLRHAIVMPLYMLCLDRGWRSIATFAPPLHTSASVSQQTNGSGTAFVAPGCEPRCNQWALVPKREPSLLERACLSTGSVALQRRAWLPGANRARRLRRRLPECEPGCGLRGFVCRRASRKLARADGCAWPGYHRVIDASKRLLWGPSTRYSSGDGPEYRVVPEVDVTPRSVIAPH